MSKFEDGSYQCLPGPALIAKVLAGRCTMNYTRAAVGQGSIPEGVSPKSLTEPPDHVMDAKIAAVTTPVDGECQVTVQINSDDVETGFYAMGILLYAEDPDLGEVPYTYLKLEEGMEWIRPASSAVGKLATFDLIAAVGAVDVVSANIDPDAIMTRAAVEQLVAEATALSTAEIFIPKDGWRPTEDQQEAIESGLMLYQDIAINGVRSDQFPAVSIRKDDIRIAQQAGLCTTAQTLDGAIRLWTKETPSRDVEATLGLYDARSAAIKDITIPADGWQRLESPTNLELYGEFAFYQDVKVPAMTMDRYPTISLHIPSLVAARDAGLCPSVQPLTGAIRFWSVHVPEQDLSATAALLFHASGMGLVTSHAVIMDGVKVRKGSGLNIDENGFLSLDTASSEQVRAMFK